MYNVMIVDDDELVLKSIKRVLRMCNDLEVEYFTSPVDALKRCQTKVFDVIVSDYRMPESNGVDFLVRVKEIQPESVRVILSAQVDTGVLTSAINDAAIFKLIVKPWKNGDLVNTIIEASRLRYKAREDRILSDIVRAENIVPFHYLTPSPLTTNG